MSWSDSKWKRFNLRAPSLIVSLLLGVVATASPAEVKFHGGISDRLQSAAETIRKDAVSPHLASDARLRETIRRQSLDRLIATLSALAIAAIAHEPAYRGEILDAAVAAAPEVGREIEARILAAYPVRSDDQTAFTKAIESQPEIRDEFINRTAGVYPGYADSSAAVGGGKYSRHDYTLRFRPTVWSVFVEGSFESTTPLGRVVSVALDDDLGYDDPYPTFNGELSFRRGRHDVWVTGFHFDHDQQSPIKLEFEIGGDTLEVGGLVDTEAAITDINFRYGYSFFEYEPHGFRLGPTIAVSYTDIDFRLNELSIGGNTIDARFRFKQTLPIPTLGLHGEVPLGDFVISGQIGGFYADIDDFEVIGIRSKAGVTWRPYDHVGFFAGMYALYIDVELNGPDIDHMILWGPHLGLEVHF